mgnify:CR=1 FL=1
MGITFGGLMRGALPVLQQGLEAPMQNATERMDTLGKQYNAKAGAWQKQEAAALGDLDKVKTLADSMGVDIGIAEAAYKMGGKNIDKASKIVNNMVKAYKGNIPTSKLAVNEMPAVPSAISLDKTETIDVGSKDASSDTMFKSFSNLFKMYSPDRVKEMLADRSGVPLQQIDKVLNNTFNLPTSGATVRPTVEAMRKGMDSPDGKTSESGLGVEFYTKYYGDKGYNKEEALRAAETHVRGGMNLKGVNAGGDSVLNIVSKNGEITQQVLRKFQGGFEINPNKDSRLDNEKRLSSAEKSLSTISTVKGLLFKNPQVFTAFGRLQEMTTNVLDLIGMSDVAKDVGGDDVKKAIQAARQFIKTAKEDIFDDPRISDRDLAIINQYIGIIMDDSFLGVGQTNALAAIIGLERASATQMAVSLHTNTPRLQNKFVELTSDGFLDVNKESVAQEVFVRMMTSYGITQGMLIQAYKDKNNTDKSIQDKANYTITQVDNLMELAKNSVQSLKARTSYSTSEEFKNNYKNVYINTLGGKSNEDLKGNN